MPAAAPRVGVVLALGSAVLFGASTPLAKLVLGTGVDPWLMAGLLYLGSGAGLAVYRIARGPGSEAPLVRSDWGWMALVVLAGGVAGPLLLMLGLSRTTASAASLLLNLEGLATMGIAWLVLRENVDRRLLAGALAIVAGAAVLSWQGGRLTLGPGALLIAAACLAWGIDNNLTRKLSGSDPVQIAAIKGLAAGAVNLTLAIGAGARLPGLLTTAGVAAIGLAGYGVSLVLFVLALRNLGSARTGAYFSMAPFVGALVAILVLREPMTPQVAVATLLMGIGLYLHLVERHDHVHVHEPLTHEHAHVHDAHHRHAHPSGISPGEPHTHAHHHPRLVHGHPHFPDLHHRHRHAEADATES